MTTWNVRGYYCTAMKIEIFMKFVKEGNASV
jgi:hypothetical protein